MRACHSCGKPLHYDYPSHHHYCLECLQAIAGETRHMAHNNDPDTSHAAAASVDATRLENMVFAEYLSCGLRGATQDELLEAFPDFSYSSITARPSALKRKGLVIDTGVKRKGRSGRMQRVLVAAEYLE